VQPLVGNVQRIAGVIQRIQQSPNSLPGDVLALSSHVPAQRAQGFHLGFTQWRTVIRTGVDGPHPGGRGRLHHSGTRCRYPAHCTAAGVALVLTAANCSTRQACIWSMPR
jgi:hypothetical protein